MDDRVSKEMKLKAAADIVSHYIQGSVVKEGEHNQRPAMSPDEVCQFLRTVYQTIEDVVPDKEKPRVGLGA